MKRAESANIHLDDLRAGSRPGITPDTGSYLAEAAAFMFEFCGHASGRNMKTTINSVAKPLKVTWDAIHEDAVRSHGDRQEATEYGACGVALLLITKFTAYCVLERSFKGTHVDYYLATREGGFPFQASSRLEVSGIGASPEQYDSRWKQKIRQVQLGGSDDLPCLVAVIDFVTPRSLVEEVK